MRELWVVEVKHQSWSDCGKFVHPSKESADYDCGGFRQMGRDARVVRYTPDEERS